MKKSHKKILKTLGGIALLKKLLPGLRDDKDFDVSSYMDGEMKKIKPCKVFL